MNAERELEPTSCACLSLGRGVAPSLPPLLSLTLLLLASGGAACSEPQPLHLETRGECEGISELLCALPYPSNFYTVADSTSPTGLRVAFPEGAMPENAVGEPFDPAAWAQLDGFSTGPTIFTAFKEPIDPSNLSGYGDYSPSLRPTSPTLLIDEDGKLVPHFAESDGLPGIDEPVAFYIRPARRLEEGKRYIVALRSLKGLSGEAMDATPYFRALRDKVSTDLPSLEARRAHFETIFEALAKAGIEREGLIQAWDFTTASGQGIRGDLLYMRDDAMTRVGAQGVGCKITKVTEPGNEIFRRIDGSVTVPSYMSHPGTMSTLMRDAEGRPAFQEMVEARFVANIPASLAAVGASPGRLISYGHGQLGSPEEVIWGGGRRIADSLGAVLVSTDLLGMSELDLAAVTRALANVSSFNLVTDRLHQGIINELVLTRTMAGACASLPEFQVGGQLAYDPSDRYYLGISQGAIFGFTYMALAQDIERGVLNVGGANYAYIVDRSRNFVEFEDRLINWYERRVDRRLLIALMEQLWEHTEGFGYLNHVISDPLPDTPAKKLLFSVGKNDVQVPNLSASLAARSMNLPLLDPASAQLPDEWDLERKSAPIADSAFMVFDLGDPAVPRGSQPPEVDGGVHGNLRSLPEQLAQFDAFLKPQGSVINPCSGVCDPN